MMPINLLKAGLSWTFNLLKRKKKKKQQNQKPKNNHKCKKAKCSKMRSACVTLRNNFKLIDVKRPAQRISIYFFFFFFFFGFRALLAAYEVSQARGRISYSSWPTPQPQQHGIWAVSATYTTAHTNGSPTHWTRPWIKPKSSWILVGFVSTMPQRKLRYPYILYLDPSIVNVCHICVLFLYKYTYYFVWIVCE